MLNSRDTLCLNYAHFTSYLILYNTSLQPTKARANAFTAFLQNQNIEVLDLSGVRLKQNMISSKKISQQRSLLYQKFPLTYKQWKLNFPTETEAFLLQKVHFSFSRSISGRPIIIYLLIIDRSIIFQCYILCN